MAIAETDSVCVASIDPDNSPYDEDYAGMIWYNQTNQTMWFGTTTAWVLYDNMNGKDVVRGKVTANTVVSTGQISNKQSAASLVTNITSSNVTYTSTEVLSGLIIRDCAGETRNDILPPGDGASGIVNSLDNAEEGTTFELLICNASSEGEDLIINNNSTSAVVIGANLLRAGENTKFRGIVMSIAPGSEVYHLFSYGNKETVQTPIVSGPNYLYTINQNSNHTWTPVELYSGFVRRISTSNREDVLPNASDFLIAYPNSVVGDVINLLVLKTTSGRMDFNTSPNGTFVARSGGGGTFTALGPKAARAGNNQVTTFAIIIYEVDPNPKIEIIKVSRN